MLGIGGANAIAKEVEASTKGEEELRSYTPP